MILNHPQFIKTAVESYFENRRVAKVFDEDQDATTNVCLDMPTPEEYALHLGFANFTSLKRAIENEAHPEESRHYLLVGCALISDMYTRAGLTGKLNNSFTKFIMSAYLGINEKTEQTITEDRTIRITWTDDTHRLDGTHRALLNDPDIIELERLEAALPPSMQLPAPNTPAPTLEDILE
jgi:hypothetical protein